MKKVSILLIICMLTFSIVLAACQPTTKPEDKPSSGGSTTTPDDKTTNYTYQFAIGNTQYKAIYEQSQTASNSVLKLYQGDTVVTQQTVSQQATDNKNTVVLSYGYKEMTVKLNDDKTFSVQAIDNDFEFVVGNDYFAGSYTSNDVLTPKGQLTVDSQGKATLKVDNQTIAENAPYYPWIGSGIMLKAINQDTPTSATYLTIDKATKTFRMMAYAIFESQPEYLFDAQTLNITSERTDIQPAQLYHNADFTKGYIVQFSYTNAPIAIKQYVFGKLAKSGNYITLQSYDIEGEQKTYKLSSTDGKTYDWTKTVKNIDATTKLTLYYDNYAIYDYDGFVLQGKVMQYLTDGTFTIVSQSKAETLCVVLDGKTYEQKYIIKDSEYNGLSEATIYTDSEGKYPDIILFDDNTGYFLLKSSMYFTLHTFEVTETVGETKITVDDGDIYHFILNKADHTFKYSVA